MRVDASRRNSQEAYNSLSQKERRRVNRAAQEVVAFLYTHDSRFEHTDSVRTQNDMEGHHGDVRDIIVSTHSGDIGISAKHRHYAVKHSRLSNTIDFGREWYAKPCSDNYWEMVRPVFNWLGELREQGYLFGDVPHKMDRIYVPILQAFIRETTDHADTQNMMKYLIGKYDFYKVIKENGSVSLQSFNIYGTIQWGKKVSLPTRIIRCEMKPKSKTTAIMYMDEGWQVSFRIHSASSKVEPSLKFDVTLIGVPSDLSTHEIPYL